MKVFITGASGYIGSALARSLRRAGHEVWGLVRNDDDARAVTQDEIRPVMGDMTDPESYREVAECCAVLVHAAADYGPDGARLDVETVDVMLAAGGAGAGPKTFVYTSGIWVYGDTGGKLVDETAPLDPPPLVARRPELERKVTGHPGVRGLVVRPGVVYGKAGGLTAMWFRGAEEGDLKVVGDGSCRWPMIHVDDLAEGYRRLVESGLGGEVFNLTDRSRFTVRELVEEVARASGHGGGITYVPVDEAAEKLGGMAECLNLDQHVDSSKAVRLLGWQPRHGGMLDEMDVCLQAWRARRGT